MASPIFISNPPPGFSMLAVLRGMQLALLGGYRLLQNPRLFQSAYYARALDAIKYSIFIQLTLWAPVVALRVFANFMGIFVNSRILESLANWLRDFQFGVLNLGVFFTSIAKQFSTQLDMIFLQSLEFIDKSYLKKHPDKPEHQYHRNLVELSQDPPLPSGKGILSLQTWRDKYNSSQEFSTFVGRHCYKMSFNVAVFFLSKLPYVGHVIVGLLSFYNLNDKIGTDRAVLVFVVLTLLPRHHAVLCLTTYYGLRSMVHDLLLPYFSRVRFTSREKEQWIKSREGLLFGFGFLFFVLIRKLPWIGLLIYGFAETSVAYLITKVSDPPPSSLSQLIHWNQTQLVWNKEKEQDVLQGTFASSDEGFSPIPGSFIFHTS